MYSFSEMGMFHYFECPHKVYVTRKLDRIEKREQNLRKFNVTTHHSNQVPIFLFSSVRPQD